MNIEIVSIGDELLNGSIINTNSAFLARELFFNGYTVERETTVPDEPLKLKKGLEEALQRSDLVITTGGLGPTLDDHTRVVAAAIFDSSFIVHQEIFEELKKRYGDSFPSLEDQATIPEIAMPLRNVVGTAPGLILKKDKRCLILLPGVPSELHALFCNEVLPRMKRWWPADEVEPVQVLHFAALNEAKVDPHLRQLRSLYPSLAVGIYPAFGKITIRLKGEEAEKGVLYLREIFGEQEFQAPNGRLEEAVQEKFVHQKRTLALAESCTGGALAARLVRLPGASNYFLGSFVCYSNQMKQEMLGVSEDTLRIKGAVSKDTAIEMAQGCLKKSGADVAFALTGIAGPLGGSTEKPVGTVFAALATVNNVITYEFHFRGDREAVIERAVNQALVTILQMINLAI